MSILNVGRVFDGVDVDVQAMDVSGDQVTFAGDILLGAVSAAARPGTGAAIRDRLSALTDPDAETVIPVTWSEDSSLDGFYRPLSASFTPSNLFAVEGTGTWQITLERFGGGALPQVELYTVTGCRANSHSVTTTTIAGSTDYRRQAVPAAATDYWNGTQSTAVTRTASTGALSCWYFGPPPDVFTSTFTVEPGDFYDGACEIRTTYGSATSQLVTGKFCPPAFDGMILSNGLVRAFLHPSVDTAFELEVYDGSAWENLAAGVGWRIEHDYGGGSTHSWDLSTASVQILTNRPERCTIRLVLAEAATVAQFGRVWIDLSVRRGEMHVAGTVRCDTMGVLGGVVALEPSSSVAATALTGGVRASTTDLPEGNRAVWAIGNGSPSLTGASGRLVQTSGQSTTPFMVGFELGGSSSSGIENAQDILYQWYNTKTEAQKVVLR